MNAKPPFILAIDQGTTSTRAMLFDGAARPIASEAVELRQFYPDNGWVEHDADEIWQATLSCCRAAMRGVSAGDIAAIGIRNQPEPSGLWDRRTSGPRAPCCSISNRFRETRKCFISSTCRARYCPRCATAQAISARRAANFSAR